MKILYAPMKRENRSFADTNILCGYDSILLNTLLSTTKTKEILYLAPDNTTEATLIAKDLKNITIIKDLKEAHQSDIMITDLANIAFAYALFFKNPVIYFLPGFVGVDIAEQKDEFFTLLNRFAIFCHSFDAIQKTLENLPSLKQAKEEMITNFIHKALI